LGLWRRNFGKSLAIAVHTFHTFHANHAIGFLAGDYAGIYVDWNGKHTTICGDGSSF